VGQRAGVKHDARNELLAKSVAQPNEMKSIVDFNRRTE
jgi:hypothetical protein